MQSLLPIWLGAGGTPASFARAGALGLPLRVAVIGGEHRRFRPQIDLYRSAGERAGHPASQLRVGVHSLGYLADTPAQAADEFYPGYSQMLSRIGAERGWPPGTRAQFDAVRGPTGALMVGDAEAVAEKFFYIDEVLGGISRITFQINAAAVFREKRLHAIELLATRVAPIVRKARTEG